MNQQLLHHVITNVPLSSSLIRPQMAHAVVEITFMILSDVMTQQKKQLYLNVIA